MNRLVKFLFPLLALVLISIPTWAATPGKLAIDNLVAFNLRADDASNLMPVDALKCQYVLAKGGNGGGSGNGNSASNGGSQQIQNQYQHKNQYQYQQDEQQLNQNQQQQQHRHGQSQ